MLLENLGYLLQTLVSAVKVRENQLESLFGNMNNYDYPMGADTSDAPWNQVDLPEREIEVTVSVTLSKTVKVMVDDYKVEVNADEDGMYESYDFSECNLHKAVEEQITLPHELAEFTEKMFNENSASLKAVGMPRHLECAIKDCKDWTVDDLEIIQE